MSKKYELVNTHDNWYKVRFNGEYAYVSAKYSKVEEETKINNKIEKIVYFTKNSNLYEDIESMNTIKEIPRLEAMPVYLEDGDYYVTSMDNRIGFVPKKDTEELTGTFTIIDISDQSLSLYKDNELILTTPVITGKKNSTPTREGLHEVWLKESDRYLTGADFKVHVDYVLFFSGGQGIHDATWRYSFGGNIYKSNGSHGCVNTPYDAAKVVYQNMKVKDKVLVKE